MRSPRPSTASRKGDNIFVVGVGEPWREVPVAPLTDKEFALFQELIHQKAGIYLSEAKKALLAGRLAKRVRALGLKSFSEYYRDVVDAGNDDEMIQMLDCVCTNETHFFREPRQFDFLETHVLPEWKALEAAGHMPRRIRIWSAACSTGEEPYSLAMTLLWHFPPGNGWHIEILATDLSTRALKLATEATWPIAKSKEIPAKYLKRFMLKGRRSQEGKMKAGPEVRSVVRFHRMNLNDASYPVTGLFNLVFCRNVLIYFDIESRFRVLRRLIDYLEPTGSYIFLGHAESLSHATDRVQSVIPSVYTLLEDRSTGRATTAARAGHGRAR